MKKLEEIIEGIDELYKDLEKFEDTEVKETIENLSNKGRKFSFIIHKIYDKLFDVV